MDRRILPYILQIRRKCICEKVFQTMFLVMNRIVIYCLGEGIALIKDQLIVLTWKEHIGIRYVLKENKLRQIASFSFETSRKEGWGAASGMLDNNEVIVVSDGSCNLHIWDPLTLEELERKCIVDENGSEVLYLNELEIIDNKIYANVWMNNKLAVIDWTEGKVIRWIDFADLIRWVKLPTAESDKINAVLNGIAFDPSDNSIYITGKLWNRLFKISLLFHVFKNQTSTITFVTIPYAYLSLQKSKSLIYCTAYHKFLISIH